jgi:two-component system C4-dicarboxylate transport response regulator DctD
MSLTQKILVIDDDRFLGDFITSAAEMTGLSCLSTTDPSIFLNLLTPDITLIFMDLVMPTTDGVTLLRTLSRKQCKVGIVLMSGAGEQTLGVAGGLASTLGLHVVGHLEKPFRLQELEAILQKSKQSEF